MSPSPPAKVRAPRALSPSRTLSVSELLRELGPRLRRGDAAPAEPARRLATGLPTIDRLVGGGLPPGRLTEIAGPLSSGRTSLALALLARATRAGEVVAVVDAADALDPGSAEAAGVRLERVLWVRPPGGRDAARCAERLLEAHGFALVLLDLDVAAPALPAAAWQRLVRAAAATGTALVALSRLRAAGSHADLALEMQAPRAHFSESPALLEGLAIEARVVRHRAGPAQRVASLRLRTRAA